MTISIVSEGDNAARSVTFDVEVFAYEEEDQPANSDDSSDDDEDSSNGLSVESNTLPGMFAVEAIAMIAAGGLLRRKKTEM